MGSENVETLKRANEALNRGDFEGLAAAYASDAELVDRANTPDQSTAVTGRDAMICATHWHGRGRASGASANIRQYDVYELRDGEVIRATLGCRSEEEAREVAG